MGKKNSKLVIDTSKDSYKKIAEKIKSFHGKRIAAEAFNSLSQSKKLQCLRTYSGIALEVGKNRISCLDVNHADAHPSMGWCEDTGGFHCFSCDLSCDIFDLIGAVYGIRSFKEQYSKAVQIFVQSGGDTQYKSGGKKSSSYKYNSKGSDGVWSKKTVLSAAMKKQLHNPHYKDLAGWGRDYVCTCRGIDPKIAEKYYVKYWEYNNGKYIVFINDDGSVCRRRVDDGYKMYCYGKWWNSKGNVGIFNERALDGNNIVFVCESVFDALTVMSCSEYKAVSINSLNNFGKIVRRDDAMIILLFDNDESGRSAARSYSHEYFVPDFLREGYSGDSILSKFKDINEAVTSELWLKNYSVFSDWVSDDVKRQYIKELKDMVKMAAHYDDAISKTKTQLKKELDSLYKEAGIYYAKKAGNEQFI